MGQYVDAEVKSAIGRSDVVVCLTNAVYVFEFKYDGTPDEALAQIDSKQYALPFKADGRKVFKQPTMPGDILKLTITYDADKSGRFNKSLKVYGNMQGSPIRLFVSGETH